MSGKTILIIVAGLAALSGSSAVPAPEVSSVSMSQNSQGVATISYNLSAADAVVTLDIQTNATAGAWVSIGGAAVSTAQGDVWKKVGIGPRKIKWNGASCWADRKIPERGLRAVVTAWSLGNTPDYMVVDIAAAARQDTQCYYPSADFVPGGVSGDIYKKTMLLMRKIMAKGVKWTMGSTPMETYRTAAREATHQVTLANNYYIGVYQITQSQWSLVATNSRAKAYFSADASMRPMERVSYNEIRNTYSLQDPTVTSITAGPILADPTNGSFLYLLRLKTGIDFDLPSEAQWEFAARAGNGDMKWNDGSAIVSFSAPGVNFRRLGRCLGNPDANTSVTPAETIGPGDGGTAIVGSYEKNSWGIYDMHGNVWEWCLDWQEDDITNYGGNLNINPSSLAQNLSGNWGWSRVLRGGPWNGSPGDCRSAVRGRAAPDVRGNHIGFRVLCTAGLE